MVLTDKGDDLCLETELVLKARSKVVDTTVAIRSYVGHFSDLVEHMSASEKEDADQAHRSPYIAVLNDW